MLQLHFRNMQISDLESVMQIETQIYSHPWTKGIFSDCIRVGYLCFIAEHKKKIYGYGAMSTGAGECHILNISVPKELQHQGIGKQLLQHMLSKAQQQQIKMALLEVRRSNHAAIHLYETQGFNEIGIRKDYYPAKMAKKMPLCSLNTYKPNVLIKLTISILLIDKPPLENYIAHPR